MKRYDHAAAAIIAALCALASPGAMAQSFASEQFFPRFAAAQEQSASSDMQPATMPSTTTPSTQPDPYDFFDRPLYACACGCGVYDVATSTMLPQGKGGMVWFEWDYQNQSHNWRGQSSAPSRDNEDKEIRTDFFTVGAQYMFNRSWGVQAEVPFAHRFFKAIDEDTGNLASTEWTSLGDIRLRGLYTGFLEDMSLGVNFGVKLPTGDYTHELADRDTQIGTGSTDILLGAYYRANITADQKWASFFQLEGDFPLLIRDNYRPGLEVDGAAGVYYSGFWIQKVNIIPIGQIIGSVRASDSGENAAHPVASGYQRILLSPGIEFNVHPFMIYGDVEFPVFQHMKGDQLVAPVLFKVILSYSF